MCCNCVPPLVIVLPSHQQRPQGFVIPADVSNWASIKDLFPHLLLFSEGLHQLTTLLLPLAGPQLGSFVRATVSTQFQSYCKVLQEGVAPHLKGGTVPNAIGAAHAGLGGIINDNITHSCERGFAAGGRGAAA